MSDEMVVQFCAPTLAGIKTGSLFSCPFDSKKVMNHELCRLNRILVPKGLRVLPMGMKKNRMLIYVYRPENLKKDFSEAKTASLLKSLGYESEDPDRCIMTLIQRLHSTTSFPHEIGLFLGYPIEDVTGFIENHARNSKYTGMWQVYGDEEKAKQCFSRYQQCTEVYCQAMTHGTGIERLAVNTERK